MTGNPEVDPPHACALNTAPISGIPRLEEMHQSPGRSVAINEKVRTVCDGLFYGSLEHEPELKSQVHRVNHNEVTPGT
jgi:hypothetical protein